MRTDKKLWTAAGCTVVGSRDANQDSMLVDVDRGLFSVADGVGGGFHGEIASAMGVAEVALTKPEESLRASVERAQDAVLKEALEKLGQALMGSTITSLRFTAGEVELCHVGDSRAYLFQEKILRLLTVDHEIFDEGAGGPVLSSYLGISPEVAPITILEERLPLEPGSIFLLCSDGLYKQVSEARIVELLESSHTLDEIAETLCHEASQAEYSDNVTVVLVRYHG